MKDGLVTLLGLVMVAYLFFLALVTFAFLPLAGGFFYGHIGDYYVSLILVAAASVAFSFFEKRGVACLLALVLLFAVLLYWHFAGHPGPWSKSIFLWTVLPALAFAGCAIANWLICRSSLNSSPAKTRTE